MQNNVITSLPEPDRVGQEELAHKLGALMTRINTLQDLLCADEDGDDEGPFVPDIEQIRQGLSELERMAGEMLYDLQATSGELLLAELPGLSLTEALSQLVEETAESLGLSSRIVLSGREHPLFDYLERLLYRVAQEALARVAAHEGARRLRLTLEYRRGEIAMRIEDDGVPGGGERLFENETGEDEALPPFLAAQEQSSAADRHAEQTMRRLRTMVEHLSGSLAINSGIEQGVQIQVRVPLHHPGHIENHPTPGAGQDISPADAPAKIKVLIVDSQAVSRAGLRRLLESYPDLEIVGEAGDSMQAVSETAELLPQIVLIDAQLPEEQSLVTLRRIRQLSAEIHVLLLAGREDETLFYEALRAGAGGYVSKEIAPDELAQAVRSVARGDVLVQPQLFARLLAHQERGNGEAQESLTAREREVLQLLARGLRNKEIAARLVVSERTVNFHLANIYAKLHVSGRTEALSKALEQGLLKV